MQSKDKLIALFTKVASFFLPSFPPYKANKTETTMQNGATLLLRKC